MSLYTLVITGKNKHDNSIVFTECKEFNNLCDVNKEINRHNIYGLKGKGKVSIRANCFRLTLTYLQYLTPVMANVQVSYWISRKKYYNR